ncbi:3-isopropylmalate dehydrogenase [Cutibacterium acnes JCM 18909]|nr:3-isopropylmalate dehydrogenase [Cutibacterium acnes JCM 18909]
MESHRRGFFDDSTLAEIAQEDAIVLGAVGATPDSTEVP